MSVVMTVIMNIVVDEAGVPLPKEHFEDEQMNFFLILL